MDYHKKCAKNAQPNFENINSKIFKIYQKILLDIKILSSMMRKPRDKWLGFIMPRQPATDISVDSVGGGKNKQDIENRIAENEKTC